MKKTLLLLCTAALMGKAQPYGEKLYPHPQTFCSSGINTVLNPQGFLTSGIVPSNPGGIANFYIDKTGPGGLFAPASALPFSKAYYVFGESTCSGVPQAKLMAGTDVIEAQGSALGGAYAAAGAFEHGVFFTLLDQTGNLVPAPGAPTGIATGFYPFPQPTKHATKPIIVASANPNEYIICGSYEIAGVSTMYLIAVNEDGTMSPPGSVIYNFPGNMSSFLPADMILSPYSPFGPQEVVVVGKVTNAYGGVGSGDRGFMMHFDINNLFNVMPGFFAQIYGQPVGAGGVDAFSSITVANSGSAGGNGFVIGGNTDFNPGTGFLWTIKTDPTGFTTYWNTQTQPIFDASANDVVAITERLNTSFNYEYYGAVVSGKGMMVIKLDDFGVPVATGNNEFLYYGAFAQPSVVKDISYLDNGSGSDIGIHVYGTDDFATGGFHHFVEAAFNGVSGACPQSWQFMGATSNPGPPNFDIHDINFQPGLVQCPLFRIGVQNLKTAPKVMCDDPNLPAGGDNSRMALATGISSQSIDNAFSVSPNPVSDKMEIRYTASQSDVVDIKLYDYLGRLIQSVPATGMDNGNAHVASLDLSTLNIESGIYIVKTSINGVSSQQKIIYTKGQ